MCGQCDRTTPERQVPPHPPQYVYERVCTRLCGRDDAATDGHYLATPSPIRMWRWQYTQHDRTTAGHQLPPLLPQYACGGGSTPNTTARPPGTNYRHSFPNTHVAVAVHPTRPHDLRAPITATPSPTDSLVAHGRLAHPSHALVSTPSATHEARATASQRRILSLEPRVTDLLGHSSGVAASSRCDPPRRPRWSRRVHRVPPTGLAR